jgi:hypothetical protein
MMYALGIDCDVTQDLPIKHYCNCGDQWPQSVSVPDITDYPISNRLQQSLGLAK